MFQFLWQAFVTLFVVINPVAVVATFVSLTPQATSSQKSRIALKSIIISTVLLLAFAFAGDKLLDTMSISEAAFGIAGGFLLLMTAIAMVIGPSEGKKDEESAVGPDIAVFPLAIPMIAGPGALTSVVVLMRQAELIDASASMGVVITLVILLAIIYIFMLGGNVLMKLIGRTGTDVMTRVCGIMLAALAVQNIISGIIGTIKINFNI